MNVWQFVSGCIGSGGLILFVQFLITRHDNRKGMQAKILSAIAELREQGKKQEKDSCRTQMLLLLSNFPGEKQEIMTLAKHYFMDLEGDWYATSMFRSWLQKNSVAAPIWFNSEHHEKEK